MPRYLTSSAMYVVFFVFKVWPLRCCHNATCVCVWTEPVAPKRALLRAKHRSRNWDRHALKHFGEVSSSHCRSRCCGAANGCLKMTEECGLTNWLVIQSDSNAFDKVFLQFWQFHFNVKFAWQIVYFNCVCADCAGMLCCQDAFISSRSSAWRTSDASWCREWPILLRGMQNYPSEKGKSLNTKPQDDIGIYWGIFFAVGLCPFSIDPLRQA